MQEEPKGTSKLERIRRGNNGDVAEITRKNVSDISPNIRTVTSRSKIMIPDLPKKKTPLNRQSIMPSQLSLNTQKKVDIELKELELGLLYDEYLRSMMMDLIITKKIDERTHLFVTKLATVMREIDRDAEKLINIKMRERDIISLTMIQEEIDAHLVAITKCTKNKQFNTLQDIQFKLRSMLEPLDRLYCKNISLPETANDWVENEKELKKCSSTLKNIIDKIGLECCTTYCTMNDKLKIFASIYNEIEDLQKKLKEAICNVQVFILKNASYSLMQNKSIIPKDDLLKEDDIAESK